MDSDHREFGRLMALLDYPMFIVTTAAGDVHAGCLVGFATQASIDPPRFLVCLSNKNLTYRLAIDAEVLAVHLVAEDARELAELFGGETGDDTDKLARVRWRPGPSGVPVLTELENWFAGRIVETADFGDHRGFLLDPIEGHAGASEESLTFHRTKAIQPGHEP